MDKKEYLDNAGSFLTRIGLLQHWGFMAKDGKEFSREREIFSAKGACMLIKREVIEKVGLFDKDFGSYFEESDFCWRVWLAGWRVLYYPEAEIDHKVGFTSKRMDQVEVTLKSSRNRIASLFKNLGRINLLMILVPHLGLIIGLGVYYLVRLQIRKAWMMFGAIVANVRNIPKLIKKRKKVQQMRVKKDSEIFPVVMQKMDLKEMVLHFRKVEANF